MFMSWIKLVFNTMGKVFDMLNSIIIFGNTSVLNILLAMVVLTNLIAIVVWLLMPYGRDYVRSETIRGRPESKRTEGRGRRRG